MRHKNRRSKELPLSTRQNIRRAFDETLAGLKQNSNSFVCRKDDQQNKNVTLMVDK